jgi:hypothetical protein
MFSIGLEKRREEPEASSRLYMRGDKEASSGKMRSRRTNPCIHLAELASSSSRM